MRSIVALPFALVALASALHAQQPAPPELPRVLLDTRMPATRGHTIAVPARGDLQRALDSAQPGDEVVLQAGATYVGNFVLPVKRNASRMPGTGPVITIRSSGLASLREGRRVGPSDAASMARLMTVVNGADPVIGTSPGTAGWRIAGLEITTGPTVTQVGRLVRLGDGSNAQNSVASVPANLVLDRSYVHAGPTVSVRRCIDLQSAASAVIDSYLSACHANGEDAQAIGGWNGPGPYKIANNYLEASTENIMFGGADPSILNQLPSDIEIRGNHFFKPLAWKNVWLVKNLFELKIGQRMLIEGNVFENNWQHGQGGGAIALKSTNQDGRCTWCGTRDITFRLNVVKNTGAGFVISASPDVHHTDFPLQRVSITDNIVANIDVQPTFNGDGRGFLLNQDIADVVIAHNTVISPTNSAVTFGGPPDHPPLRLVIRDNIIGGGLYGVKGEGAGSGSASIAAYMRGGVFEGNVITLSNTTGFPGGNVYPTNLGLIGFADAPAMDFRLSPTSRLKKRGTDGRDPGADVDSVNAAIKGVVIP